MIDFVEQTIKTESVLQIGVDEVGRGPLAGPVVAAAVAIKTDEIISGKLLLVNDSKKISDKLRRELSACIYERFNTGIGVASVEEVDELNVLQATFLAMRRAVTALDLIPDMVFVDGSHKIPGLAFSQKACVKGDQNFFCIAAASIVAKVFRDDLMNEMDKLYPGYFFESHKGYGTKLHMEKIKELGITKIHRKTFEPVKSMLAAC